MIEAFLKKHVFIAPRKVKNQIEKCKISYRELLISKQRNQLVQLVPIVWKKIRIANVKLKQQI